uniref:Uncharacterized protein ORF110 n=1 Tax=Nothoceros aenigmaticus TaxID=13813 RepID=C3RYL3_9EMBR|nr:hypothetical protein MeaeMp01 [Nothoceros aenigmaticus]ACC86770.1 hypothetical protein MeaeMp01 [Nothoceros aenigmaticus]
MCRLIRKAQISMRPARPGLLLFHSYIPPPMISPFPLVYPPPYDFSVSTPIPSISTIYTPTFVSAFCRRRHFAAIWSDNHHPSSSFPLVFLSTHGVLINLITSGEKNSYHR